MADNYIEKQYEAYEARKAAWEKTSKYKRKKPAAETAGRPCERLFHNHSKKVVAIHDLSGAGRVSLMAVIPILSTMGLQVCPLPTAILSTHTQYPAYSFLDLTDEMKRIIDKWEQLDIRFDAFYSGYLGSPRQAQIVESFIRKFRRQLIGGIIQITGQIINPARARIVRKSQRFFFFPVLIQQADIRQRGKIHVHFNAGD